jgi:hypothetical protein
MKYIIDIPDDTSYANVVKVIDGNVANVKTLRLAEMEKCDPDQMQQDSYFLGVDDGRKLGQDEAWELAKKVRFADFVDDKCVLRSYLGFFDTYQEAKEKFDSYIESQGEIEVGDEVVYEESDSRYNGTKGYVEYIYDCGLGGLRDYVAIINKSGRFSFRKEFLRKTGNHNSKLAEAIKEITG